MISKATIIFTFGLWLISKANSQSEAPRIVVSPSSQCANQTSFLRWTCIAYAGQESTYQPTSIRWYNGASEELTNSSSQVTVYNNIVMIDGMVFIESTLEARMVYSHLTGQSSCFVSNPMGEDRANWILFYDIEPPVTIIMKPANQIVNYTSVVRMTCLAYVQQEVANDTSITWWGEFGQITAGTGLETAFYTTRVWSGDLLFVESILEICSVSYVHIGELSCLVENALGRDVATWIVEPPVEYPPPMLSISQTNVLVNYGGIINVSCNANVGPLEAYEIDPPEIMWLDAYGQQIITIPNQINIYTVTSADGSRGNDVNATSILEIDRIGTSDQFVGKLRCVVKSAFGTDTANFTVQLYEILTSPQLILTPNNQTVDCRSRVTITCVINAFPVPQTEWYFNSIIINSGATESLYINGYYGSTIGLNFTETYLDICDFNDENIGSYSCSASNVFGNYTSDPVWIDIDPQSAPPVLPPTITAADRSSNDKILVRFEPQSPGNFEISLYVANDSQTPYLVRFDDALLMMEVVNSIQATIEQSQAMFTELKTCNSYWVVVTAQYCTRRSSTEPMYVGLYSLYPYELTLTLGAKNSPCDSWISIDPEIKVADMEKSLLKPTSACGYDIPCFDGSRWKCIDEDPLKVTFETQIVGYSQEINSQIKKCIDDWIMAEKAVGQTFTLGGSNLTVVNYEESLPSGVSLPVWGWVVIGVGAMLLVVCFVTFLFVGVVVTKRRSQIPVSKKNQRLIDNYEEEDDHNSHNDYTVAVIDNPLYAENEGDIEDYIKDLEEDEDKQQDFDEDVTKTDI